MNQTSYAVKTLDGTCLCESVDPVNILSWLLSNPGVVETTAVKTWNNLCFTATTQPSGEWLVANRHLEVHLDPTDSEIRIGELVSNFLFYCCDVEMKKMAAIIRAAKIAQITVSQGGLVCIFAACPIHIREYIKPMESFLKKDPTQKVIGVITVETFSWQTLLLSDDSI